MKIILFLSIFLQISRVSALEQTGLSKICDKMDKVAMFMSQIKVVPFSTTQMTPAGPVYGVVMATVEENGAIGEFCSYYNRLRNLEGADKAFLASEYFNKLTAKKYNNHISFMRDTYDLGETLNNVNKLDSNTLEKVRMAAPHLNNYLASANDYSVSVTGNEIESFNGRAEQETRMRNLLNATSENAAYQSILKCEDSANSKDYSLYMKDISSKEEEDKYLEADINYLVAVLKDMGIKFSDSLNYREYLKDINTLITDYSNYSSQLKTRSIPVEQKRFKKTKPVDPNESPTETFKTTQKREYQVMSVTFNEEVFSKFLKKYAVKWDHYVKSNVLDDPEKVFQGASNVFQQKHKDYFFECRDSLIYRKAKEKKPELFSSIDNSKKDEYINELRNECLASQTNQKDKIGNLFTDYVNNLKDSIIRSKKLRADIWTIDSFHNGTLRVINKSEVTKKDIPQEEITCSKDINFTTMNALSLKQKTLKTTLRKNLLEEKIKNVAYKEAKVKKDIAQEKELERRSLIGHEAKKRMKSFDIQSQADPTKGGL